MYFVYILQSLKTGEFYKGLTENVEGRIKQHNSGKVISTAGKYPLRLVHVEICKSRIEARKVEKYFKSGFGREIVEKLAKY